MAVAELVREFSVDEALHTIRVNGKVHAKYGNYIGGRWTPPVTRPVLHQLQPHQHRSTLRICQIHARRCGESPRCRACGPGPLGPHLPRRACCDLAPPSPTACKRIWNSWPLAETLDNGKPIRETRNADVPLAIDHFRYFAACIRAEEGSVSEIDEDTIAYHFKEPLGVVGQIIPWNFPLLMAAWKLAPALGAGNCVGDQAGIQYAAQPRRSSRS